MSRRAVFVVLFCVRVSVLRGPHSTHTCPILAGIFSRKDHRDSQSARTTHFFQSFNSCLSQAPLTTEGLQVACLGRSSASRDHNTYTHRIHLFLVPISIVSCVSSTTLLPPRAVQPRRNLGSRPQSPGPLRLGLVPSTSLSQLPYNAVAVSQHTYIRTQDRIRRPRPTCQ